MASAGLSPDADEPLTPALLQWAHVIFAMEKRQRTKLQRDFGDHLKDQRVVCLYIPDRYGYIDEALGERLKSLGPTFGKQP